MNMEKLRSFKGNILSPDEKLFRMTLFEHAIEQGEIDLDFIPFLRKLNQYCIMTVQCCTGHGTETEAYLDFRSMMPVEFTIDHIIRPVENKFPGCKMTIYTEQDRLRYCIWLENDQWKKIVEFLLEVLERITHKMVCSN